LGILKLVDWIWVRIGSNGGFCVLGSKLGVEGGEAFDDRD